MSVAEKGQGSKAERAIGIKAIASIPLRYYRKPAGDGVDLAATFNQPRNSYWINIHSSGCGPTTNVSAITVAMDYPVGSPTLEIRSVRLATQDPGDAVLEGKPLIDEFGQYTHANWQGKAKSLDDLKKAWAGEAAGLKSTPAGRCPYGGFRETRGALNSDSARTNLNSSRADSEIGAPKATGFFRVEQMDGRWWFVCPDGHLFYSTGVNGYSSSKVPRIRRWSARIGSNGSTNRRRAATMARTSTSGSST